MLKSRSVAFITSIVLFVALTFLCVYMGAPVDNYIARFGLLVVPLVAYLLLKPKVING
jgi:hypothetical protein